MADYGMENYYGQGQSGKGYPPQQAQQAQQAQQGGYPPQGYPPQQGYGQPPPLYSAQPQPIYSVPPVTTPLMASYTIEEPPMYAPPEKLDLMLIQDQPVRSPQWNDVWATFLFVLHLVGACVIAGVSFMRPQAETPFFTEKDQKALIYSLLGSGGFSLVFGIFFFSGMRSFPVTMIIIAIVINIIICLGYAVISFLWHNVVGGVIWLLIVAFLLLWYVGFRYRIPFAAVMLASITQTLSAYPSTLLASAVAVVLQIGYSIFFIFVISEASGVFTNGTLFGIFFYMVFSYYWTSQVIKNVGHVTNCGLFATIYFLGGSNMFPRNPVYKSFQRAMTFSFGSICFGSLIVALIQTLRYLIRVIFGNSYLRCFLDCILGCIDNLVQYFNHFAYAEIAIFGKSFCQAGRDTWNLFLNYGIDIIVNENLIGNVLYAGIFVAALGSFGIGYGIAYFNADSDEALYLISVAALFVGGTILVVLCDVIDSGATANIVCMAESPMTLKRTNPALYAQFQSTYTGIRLP